MSVPDARLYNISFTGRAKSINRCAECYSEDHLAYRCPTLINQSLTALVQAAASPHAYQTFPPHKPNWTLALPGGAQETCRRYNSETCRRYNSGTCRSRICKYVHACWPTPTVRMPYGSQSLSHWPGQGRSGSKWQRYWGLGILVNWTLLELWTIVIIALGRLITHDWSHNLWLQSNIISTSRCEGITRLNTRSLHP